MRLIKIDEQGNFTLYKEIYPWKTYGTTHGYYRNTKTGENCGQTVELYEGDEDYYELVDNEEVEQNE